MDNYSSPNATNSFSILGDPIYRWELILAAVVTSLVSIAGLTGNSLIIAAVVLSQKLQTSTNAFVTSLAIVDLLTSFFLILSIVTNQYVWSAESNPLFCVVDFIIRLFLLTSAYHLAAIGFNRLIYITKPFLYKTIFTSWKLAILVAMPSIISIGAILIIVWMPLSEEFYNVTMCWRFQLFPEELEWVMPSLSVACAIPLAVIIMSYVLLHIYLQRHWKRMQNLTELPLMNKGANCIFSSRRQNSHVTKEQVQITRNLFLSVCAFIVCFFPYGILQIAIQIEPTIENHYYYFRLRLYADLILFTNSAINFFIYGYKHPHFKVVLGHMMNRSYAEIPEPSRLLRYILSWRI